MVSDLLIILLLVCINGLFSMSEIAMVSVRKSRLEGAAKRGDRQAKLALRMQQNPGKLLSTVQIGMTLMSILTGIYSEKNISSTIAVWISKINFLYEYADSIALVIVVIAVTALTLIVGELVPKRIGLTFPESISKVMAGPMILVSIIAAPFIWVLTKASDLLFSIIRVKRSSDDKVTEEEIRAIIQEGTETGAIKEIEQDIVERVFHLGDRKIASLMTHRNEIVWLNKNDSPEKTMETIETEVHSIYPVCEGNLDHATGIVYLKDLFIATKLNNFKSVEQLTKPVLFLPENNTAYSVLEKFKQSKIHYALVVDEYGAVQGLVTINDILEALVGEFDELNLHDYNILQRDDGTYLIDAGIPFYDFLKYFEIEEFDTLDEQQYNTIAGFIIHELKHIPKEGEKIKWKDFEFEIIDMDATRIDKVLFKTKR